MKRLPRWTSRFSVQGQRLTMEDDAVLNAERAQFVVADGFGGPTAGVEAAHKAVTAVSEFMEREAGDLEATLPFVLRSYLSLGGNVLFNAFIHANRELAQWNETRRVHLRGGASVVAGFVDGDCLSIALAGVCQATLFRETGGIWTGLQLLEPHSYSRLLNPFQSQGSRASGGDVPLMCLGISGDLEPEMAEFKLEKGDALLLTSGALDAQTRLPVDELLSTITHGESPSSAVLDRFQKTLQSESMPDNLSGLWIGF